MLQFIFSYILLLIIVLWWAEAKYNFIHGTIMCLKKVCDWIKDQTKLKIDICKLLGSMLVLGVVGYLIFLLINYLYIPYFKNFIKVEDSAVLVISKAENNSSLVGDWGTFGDFIGGTLNPILTFISICLILYTVYQNKKALDFNSQELEMSRKAQQESAASQKLIQQTQNLQQFDSFFFSLLDQFIKQQDKLCQENAQSDSKVNEIYRIIFKDSYLKSSYHKNAELLNFNEVNQYFSLLFVILRMIYTRRNDFIINNNEGIDDLERKYIDILQSLIPQKLQQLLFLKVCYEASEHKKYVEYFSFFECMSFHDLNYGHNEDKLCFDLISEITSFISHGEQKAFGDSIYLDMILNASVYGDFIISNKNMRHKLNFMKEEFIKFHEIYIRVPHNSSYIFFSIKTDKEGLNISFGEKEPQCKVDTNTIDNIVHVPYRKIYFNRHGLEFQTDNGIEIHIGSSECGAMRFLFKKGEILSCSDNVLEKNPL